MTYPQQYNLPAPVQGYPPQQPGYPVAPPPGPQYAQQPYGYPQAQPGYPVAAPQQPAPQLANGTLDAYWSQPSSGGGAALKFEVGTRHVGIVTRPITNADIQQQTQPGTGQPAFFRDGRPKFVMKVPLQTQPAPDRPDGLAQWYVAGAARDELVRAMTEVGAPSGPPEAGAIIDITCTGTRPAGAGMNPAKVYQVAYQRPQGADAVHAPAPQAPAPPPAAPQPAPPLAQPPMHPQGYAAPAAPPVAAPAIGQVPTDPAKAALLAQLTGQAAAS